MNKQVKNLLTISLPLFLLLFSVVKIYALCWCDGDAKICQTCDGGHQYPPDNTMDCVACNNKPGTWCEQGTTTYKCCKETTSNCGCWEPATLDCRDYGLSSRDLGFGSKTISVTEICGTSRVTCYCTSSCTGICPAELSSTDTSISPLPNLILSGFASCNNGCMAIYKDCWEKPSRIPTEQLSINSDPINEYGFSSNTHSGKEVNNPIEMSATFTDEDGSTDIEGLLVWYRDVLYGEGSPGSPLWLSTTATPKGFSTNSWGFLMRREGNLWVPYLPTNIPDPNPDVWAKANYSTTSLGTIFYLPDPNGVNMVKVTVTLIQETPYGEVLMKYTLDFIDDNIAVNVLDTKYRILLLGLDKFSFTPYDNYTFSMPTKYWQSNQLRYRLDPVVAQTYARDWSYMGRDWVIDHKDPTINSFNVSLDTGNKLKVEWNVEDKDSNNYSDLYAVVGSVYIDKPSEAKPLTISSLTGIPVNPSITPQGIPSDGIIGSLNDTTNYFFKVSPNISSTSNTGTVYVDVGDNRSGTLHFYLTLYDDAGNMVRNDTTFNLDDWIVTDGGLAYSNGGTTYVSKKLTSDTVWNGINGKPLLPPSSLLTVVGESLVPTKADISSEMFANSNEDPLHSAYFLGNHDYNLPNKGLYNTLLESYEKKKESIHGLEEKSFPPTWDKYFTQTTLKGYCNDPQSQYCVIKITSDVIFDNTSCDINSLIFVDGNLTIQLDSGISIPKNNINQIGCIFVVNGDINIIDLTEASNFQFDVIPAFLVSDGKITINKEGGIKKIRNGLYINGGLVSGYTSSNYNESSIVINRYLNLDKRLTFPSVAIDAHPKYGVLGGIFFSNPISLQKLETGFKPN